MSKIKSKISILLIAMLVPAIGIAGVSNNQAAYSQYDYEKYLIVKDKVSDSDKDHKKDNKKSIGQLLVTQKSAPTFTTSTVSTNDPSQFAVSTALCSNDEEVTGGGWEFDTSQGTTGNEHIIMEKATGNGWSVFVNVPSLTFKAYAECAKIVP